MDNYIAQIKIYTKIFSFQIKQLILKADEEAPIIFNDPHNAYPKQYDINDMHFILLQSRIYRQESL